MIDRSKIVNFDFQGWPEEKMNLRDILESLGAKLTDGNWVIPESPKLDIFPKIVEDDGMGYGVHEEFITAASLGDDYCTIFREKELEHIEIWLNAHICPGACGEDADGTTWMFDKVIETDGEFKFSAKEWIYTGEKEEKIKFGQTRLFTVDEAKNFKKIY